MAQNNRRALSCDAHAVKIGISVVRNEMGLGRSMQADVCSLAPLVASNAERNKRLACSLMTLLATIAISVGSVSFGPATTL